MNNIYNAMGITAIQAFYKAEKAIIPDDLRALQLFKQLEVEDQENLLKDAASFGMIGRA